MEPTQLRSALILDLRNRGSSDILLPAVRPPTHQLRHGPHSLYDAHHAIHGTRHTNQPAGPLAALCFGRVGCSLLRLPSALHGLRLPGGLQLSEQRNHPGHPLWIKMGQHVPPANSIIPDLSAGAALNIPVHHAQRLTVPA